MASLILKAGAADGSGGSAVFGMGRPGVDFVRARSRSGVVFEGLEGVRARGTRDMVVEVRKEEVRTEQKSKHHVDGQSWISQESAFTLPDQELLIAIVRVLVEETICYSDIQIGDLNLEESCYIGR